MCYYKNIIIALFGEKKLLEAEYKKKLFAIISFLRETWKINFEYQVKKFFNFLKFKIFYINIFLKEVRDKEGRLRIGTVETINVEGEKITKFFRLKYAEEKHTDEDNDK